VPSVVSPSRHSYHGLRRLHGYNLRSKHLLYPCYPCHPWFIPGLFLDHGLHGLHGWQGHGRQHVGWQRANQALHQTAAQRLRLGSAGFSGRRIPCRRPWSAAVGELSRSPKSAFALPMTRASSDRTAGRTTTTSCRLALIRVIRAIRGLPFKTFLPRITPITRIQPPQQASVLSASSVVHSWLVSRPRITRITRMAGARQTARWMGKGQPGAAPNRRPAPASGKRRV
jgi:hypothetical protein